MQTEKRYKVEDTRSARLKATRKGVNAFVSARYGLSVHWGLYALLGRGEWILHQAEIPHDEYRALMKRFNPVRFSAEEWADLMVESGQKFLLITTKHHDGFCMYDTKLADFKVTNTPFKRDVIGELSAALRERGIGLHFYYSLLDWTRPAYRNDWPAYVAYYRGQLKELLTNYGPIAGILFDGYWPREKYAGKNAYFRPGGKWGLAGTYDLIHKLQPDCVVTNNIHALPLKGEDYQVWELDMPGENKIGFNTTEIGDRPKAVWWNLNAGWAYWPRRHDVKSAPEIVARLLEANRREATFMLNVGPRPFGDIHPDEQRALREIGAMLRGYIK